MRPRGRHRRRSSPLYRVWCGPLVTVCLIVAYSGGVGYAHWTSDASIGGSVSTGLLDHRLTEYPELIQFDCVADHQGHPISFVRIWDPDEVPPDLAEAGTGAVKIEEDRIELGSDHYSVDPELTQLGDLGIGNSPVAIYLGDVTIWITGWFEHPTLPGRHVGFAYETGETAITIDIKAARDLSRVTISESGEVWFPGAADGDPIVCESDMESARLAVENTGTIPARVYFGLSALGGAACELFDLELRQVSTDLVLYTGPLCGLLDAEVVLLDQLEPEQGDTLDLELTLVSPSTPLDVLVQAQVTLVPWNAGHTNSSGWVDSTIWDLALVVGVDYVAGDAESEAVSEDQDSAVDEEEPGGETGDAGEGTNPSVEDDIEGDTGAAGDDETDDDQPDTVDDEDPAVGAEAEEGDSGEASEEEEPYTDSVDSEDEPSGDPSPPEEHATLTGLIWEDSDEDGIRLPGANERGLGKVTVTIYAQDGNEIARTKSARDGSYTLEGLQPGQYFVEVSLPKGYGFIPPVEAIHEDFDGHLAALSETLDLSPGEIVVGDIMSAELHEKGWRWVGATEVFSLVAGDNPGLGDAAVVATPTEETADGQGASRPPGADRAVVVKNPNAVTTEPDRQPPVVGGETADSSGSEGETGR